MVTVDVATYKPLYLKTSHEYISEFNKNLDLLNQKQTDPTLIYEVFRLAHSLKSQNLIMGFVKTADLCKTLEEYFHAVKDNKIVYKSENYPIIQNAMQNVQKSIDNIDKSNIEIDLNTETTNLRTKLNLDLIDK